MIEAVVHRLLEAEIGLDHDAVGASSLRSAITARMKARGASDPAVYAGLLDHRDEVMALIEEVVIPETWFFRDGAPFAMVTATAERAVASGASLRVLSAPCSSGEEPYSIAMALIDAGLPPERFRIDGLDVSAALLARARAGRYGAFSFRSSDLAFRGRYFRRVEGEDGFWELDEGVRAAVSFQRDNLLAPVRLLREAPYDLIFCRNLIIYLTPVARRQVLDALAAALAPGGRIVVGHAEALDALDSRFGPVSPRGSFAYAIREKPPVAEPAPEPASRSAKRGRRAPAPVPAAAVSAAPVAPMAPMAPVAPAVPVAPRRAPAPAALLERASELADRGELAAAAALCEERLQGAPGDAAAHHLLGVVRQAAGNTEAAERCFTRALYCDPGRADSLLLLALLLERRGDASGGARLRGRAARATPRRVPA